MDQPVFPSYFLDVSPHHRGKNLFLVLQPPPQPNPPIFYAGSGPFNLWQGSAVQGSKLARSHYLTITVTGARECGYENLRSGFVLFFFLLFFLC